MKTYVGDTGTVILLDTKQDISVATSVSISAKTPKGEVRSWSGAVVETTKVQYVTTAETFSEPGTWTLQAVVVTPAGRWRGESVELRVYANFT